MGQSAPLPSTLVARDCFFIHFFTRTAFLLEEQLEVTNNLARCSADIRSPARSSGARQR
jgi:hypothetical protein